MATSGSIDPAHQAVLDELLTLADLAGIKAPGNTMKAVIELAMAGAPPSKIHILLREILANKNRTRRVTSKHSSRRSNTAAEAVQDSSSAQPQS